jgi:hypothetical protein
MFSSSFPENVDMAVRFAVKRRSRSFAANQTNNNPPAPYD